MHHTLQYVRGTRRCGRYMSDGSSIGKQLCIQVKGIVPGIMVSWWLLPGLMVLGLLALGASAVSQHRMPHPTPQQPISASPTASYPSSLPTPAPMSQRGRRIWVFGEKRLSRVRCEGSKYWTYSQVPQRREPACAQIVTVSRALDTSSLASMVSRTFRGGTGPDHGPALRWRPGAIVPDQCHGQDLGSHLCGLRDSPGDRCKRQWCSCG